MFTQLNDLDNNLPTKRKIEQLSSIECIKVCALLRQKSNEYKVFLVQQCK